MGVKILNFFIIDSPQLSDLKKFHREKLRKKTISKEMKLLKSFLLTGLSVLAEKCSQPCGTGQLRNISQITYGMVSFLSGKAKPGCH